MEWCHWEMILFFIFLFSFKMVTSIYWFILLELVSLLTPRPFRLLWTKQSAKLFFQIELMWSVRQTCYLLECIRCQCLWDPLVVPSMPVEEASSLTWNPDWMQWTLRELQRLVIWGGPQVASNPLKVAFLLICRNLVLPPYKFCIYYDSQLFVFCHQHFF